jgi:hypothetical protein
MHQADTCVVLEQGVIVVKGDWREVRGSHALLQDDAGIAEEEEVCCPPPPSLPFPLPLALLYARCLPASRRWLVSL